MSIREEVEQIIAASKTENITAEQVVDAAKNRKKYPNLHKHLWEVPEPELAAEARIARAHRLLISVRVVTGEGQTTRMMVHTRGVPGYRPIESVTSNANLASLKLQQLTEDIARARGRLSAFKAMIAGDVADEIDEALETAEKKAASALAQPAQVAA